MVRARSDPVLCLICGAPRTDYRIVCSMDCHEKLVERLEREFLEKLENLEERARDFKEKWVPVYLSSLSGPSFDGFITEQTESGRNLIAKILRDNTDILRVVELGTGHGGMSLFLGSFICDRGGRVLTVDIMYLMDGGYELWSQSARKYNVSFLLKDVFNPETVKDISDFIAGHRAMIFCDDGDKKREVPLYAEILKKGDILLAHDFNAEFTLQDIPERTLDILEPYRPEEFTKKSHIFSMIRK